MIYTKIQLVRMLLESFRNPSNKMIRRIMNLPEIDFIKECEHDLNFRIDPIRKNQYIVL